MKISDLNKHEMATCIYVNGLDYLPETAELRENCGFGSWKAANISRNFLLQRGIIERDGTVNLPQRVLEGFGEVVSGDVTRDFVKGLPASRLPDGRRRWLVVKHSERRFRRVMRLYVLLLAQNGFNYRNFRHEEWRAMAVVYEPGAEAKGEKAIEKAIGRVKTIMVAEETEPFVAAGIAGALKEQGVDNSWLVKSQKELYDLAMGGETLDLKAAQTALDRFADMLKRVEKLTEIADESPRDFEGMLEGAKLTIDEYRSVRRIEAPLAVSNKELEELKASRSKPEAAQDAEYEVEE